MFMDAFRRSAEIEKEIKRTIHGVIKHNIGILYFYFHSHLDDENKKILENLTINLSPDLKADELITELSKINTELDHFFDAFYAHKPFILILFKFVVYNIHRKIREVIHEFWNKRRKILNALDIIRLMEAVFKYLKMLRFWGIEDSKFGLYIPSLFKIFINKLFENSKQLLSNILYDLRNKYHMENGKIVSRSSENLESHINMIIDHYKQVPARESVEPLIDLCSSTFVIFLLNIKKFLRNEVFPVEIYTAQINNCYFNVIKKLKKRVHNYTNSQVSLKELKKLVNEDLLVKLINDIEEMCKKRVLMYFRNYTRLKFLQQKSFFEFDFEKSLEETIAELKERCDKIDNKFMVNDIYTTTFDFIVDIYFEFFTKFTGSFVTKDYARIVSKIKSDAVRMEKKAIQLNIESRNNIRFKLKQMQVFIQSEDIDQVIITIMNMNIFYKNLITPDRIDNLLKAKVLFPPSSLEYISNYLKETLRKHARKASMKNKLLSTFMTYTYVLKFIKRLSKLIRNSVKEKDIGRG